MESNQVWHPDDVRRMVGERLNEFLDVKRSALAQISPDLDRVSSCVADYVVGGKRLRAIFLLLGWRCAGGPDCDAVIRAAAAMELVHAGALVHDDVIDGSDVRRGKPSVHRQFSDMHTSQRWPGSAERFGTAAAILIGDLFLVWAGELLLSCGLDPAHVTRAKSYFDTMRTELMVGQYLDVLEQAKGSASVSAALRVAEIKTTRYTLERPLQVGAALAGGADDLVAALSRYAMPLGRAFQMRDDLLGVFGDPHETGKPSGDDLREGKRTVLVALALRSATPADARLLEAQLGNRDLGPAALNALKRIIEAAGARAEVEELIDLATSEAIAALDDPIFATGPRTSLEDFAKALSGRSA